MTTVAALVFIIAAALAVRSFGITAARFGPGVNALWRVDAKEHGQATIVYRSITRAPHANPIALPYPRSARDVRKVIPASPDCEVPAKAA